MTVSLTARDRKLLALACLEEIEYYQSPEAIAVSVGHEPPSSEIAKGLRIASERLTKKYATFIEVLERVDKQKGEVQAEVDIDPKDIIVLCRDHIQTVRKHEVALRRMDGQLTQKRVWSILVQMMMGTRDKYAEDFDDIIDRLGGR